MPLVSSLENSDLKFNFPSYQPIFSYKNGGGPFVFPTNFFSRKSHKIVSKKIEIRDLRYRVLGEIKGIIQHEGYVIGFVAVNGYYDVLIRL